MRIVFIYRGAEAIGVQALMAYLEAHGHQTNLVFDPATFSGNRGRDIPFLAKYFDHSPDAIADYALSLKPDVLAFSTITGIYRWSLDVAQCIRKRKKIPTVFGGMHPTAAPDAVISEDAVDAIVLGEGEEALLELVESASGETFGRTDVKNAWIKRDGAIYKNPVRPYIADLDTLPFSKKDDYYKFMPSLKRHYKIVSSRGCPHKCTYCCNHILHGLYGSQKHVRRRSPKNVIMELEHAKKTWGFVYVEFWDDIFTYDTEWLEEFSGLYKSRIGVPFQCYAHPNFFDERRARLLAEAGCHQLKIGVQSIDETTLKEKLNRPGKKHKVAEAVKWAHDAGMNVNVEHLLDLPGEGIQSQLAAAKFYLEEARPDKIASFWLVYYPGTTIGRLAKNEGILSEQDLIDIDSGSDKFLYTFMFPGIKSEERFAKLKPYQTFFDILPWLPKKIARWLLETGNVNKLPHSSFIHQILMVLNAFRINEIEDIQAMRYTISRKRLPFS